MRFIKVEKDEQLKVLKSLCLFDVEVIKSIDPQFTSTPREIAMNPRFMRHFKVRLIFI
jgi:hypothetical protein